MRYASIRYLVALALALTVAACASLGNFEVSSPSVFITEFKNDIPSGCAKAESYYDSWRLFCRSKNDQSQQCTAENKATAQSVYAQATSFCKSNPQPTTANLARINSLYSQLQRVGR
jgi:invasion protein IalB